MPKVHAEEQLLQIFLTQLEKASHSLPNFRSGAPLSVAELLPHARLVIRLAKRYERIAQPRGLTVMDLIQEGYIGLMRAFERFDPKRNNTFGTYATWWVRSGITRVLNDSHFCGVRLPGGRREGIRNIGKVIDEMTRQLNRPPSATELAHAGHRYGFTPEQVNELLSYSALQSVGLNTPVGDDGTLTLADTIASPMQSPEEQVVMDWMMAWIRTFVDELEDRTRSVIERRYGLNGADSCSLQEIADDLRISRERVRQLERAGLRRIQRLMATDTAKLMARQRAKKARRAKHR